VRRSNVDFVSYIATKSTFGVRTAVRRGEVLRNTHGAPPGVTRLAPSDAHDGPRRHGGATTAASPPHCQWPRGAACAKRTNGDALVVPDYH
jgi:hypothetical protein